MTDALTLPLSDVRPGALLAEAITDAGGAVLLPAGLGLTEAHLQSLRRRGVETLVVNPPDDPEAQTREREKIRERVMYLFRHAVDDPGARTLLHAVLSFRQESLR